ncbi:MAG TPA: DUF72 domain-containing protein [Planctomycetota bacterium]|nr:DUF72 domain-containing protein [Planctomycetota bacterium]
MIRVGPAGWSYPDWEGRVYPVPHPPGFHPLAFLAHYFDTIEVNSSFYALPRAEHAERWARLVADRPRFQFLVKLNREFTHASTAHDAAAPADAALAKEFREGIEPLVRTRRLAAILAQFPASFRFGAAEVRHLGRVRGLFPDVQMVLETRHASWFTPPALDTIRGLSYSLAYVDLPPAWNHPPDWHAPTGPIGYFRVHGRNSAQWFRQGAERDDKYDYLYDRREVEALARQAERIASEHEETSVVTNNHFGGKAVANALEILALLRREPADAPGEIVEAFPHLRGSVRIAGQQPLF